MDYVRVLIYIYSMYVYVLCTRNIKEELLFFGIFIAIGVNEKEKNTGKFIQRKKTYCKNNVLFYKNPQFAKLCFNLI